jgi:hypothetical protein
LAYFGEGSFFSASMHPVVIVLLLAVLEPSEAAIRVWTAFVEDPTGNETTPDEIVAILPTQCGGGAKCFGNFTPLNIAVVSPNGTVPPLPGRNQLVVLTGTQVHLLPTLQISLPHTRSLLQ